MMSEKHSRMVSPSSEDAMNGVVTTLNKFCIVDLKFAERVDLKCSRQIKEERISVR